MLTLLEASKLHAGDVVRSGVIETYARSSEILRVMPFVNVAGGAYAYNQEAVLPGVGFRGVNQAWSESTGIINPQVEALRIAGGELDVDKAILKFHGDDVRTTHEAMKTKALALYLGKKMIKGSSLSDPLEFDGLQSRIAGSQLIAAGSTNGGDPLSLEKLDEGIDAVDGATHLIMSTAMRRKISKAARAGLGGDITISKNEFGFDVTAYNGKPILEVEYDEAGARILDFDEVGSTGSTATATSIYVVSLGADKLFGLQNGVMEVQDLGELESKPAFRTRIDWYVGMAAVHPRCAARIYGISNAAVTA